MNPEKLPIMHHIYNEKVVCDSVITSAAHHVDCSCYATVHMPRPFDNDTSHVQLYLTLGMLLFGMTHICFHRNKGEISVWFM